MKIVWPIIWNLATLCFVWGVLNQLGNNSGLQTIAALIMLAYVNLSYLITASTRFNVINSLATLENISLIIGNQGNSESAGNLQKEIGQISEKVKEKNPEYYINLVGLAIIWISCVIIIMGNF